MDTEAKLQLAIMALKQYANRGNWLCNSWSEYHSYDCGLAEDDPNRKSKCTYSEWSDDRTDHGFEVAQNVLKVINEDN